MQQESFSDFLKTLHTTGGFSSFGGVLIGSGKGAGSLGSLAHKVTGTTGRLKKQHHFT